MSAEEFWHGNPRLVSAYREAERMRRENRYINEWRSGVYVYQALLAASPAFRDLGGGIEHDYPSEPLFSTSPKKVMSEDDRQRAQMEDNMAAFKAMAERFNARFAEREADQGEQ